MALARIYLKRAFCGFSKRFFDKFQYANTDFASHQKAQALSVFQQVRHSGFMSSPPIDKYEGTVQEYDIVRDAPEWKFVERLLPIATIPKAPESGVFSSGWKPQNPELYEKLPYFVQRTKNFMIPVHLQLSYRNQRRVTIIRKIQGDIWALSEDIEKYLKTKHKRALAVLVNEYAGFIKIRGDYVLDTKDYLTSVGL